MSRTFRGLALLGVLICGLTVNAHAQATTLTVVPGLTPGGSEAGFNYLALKDFGYTPIAGFGDNTLVGLPVNPFIYGGTSFSIIEISSNGYITVGPAFGNGGETNQHFSDPAAPNGVLAPFWADLDPSAGGEIFMGELTDGVNKWNVVDWESVPDAKDHSLLNTFEIWMGENAVEDISYGYFHIGGSTGGIATIGAENVFGTFGANYYYNGAGTIPADRSALRVMTTGNVNLPEPTTFTLMGTAFFGVGLFAGRRRAGRA